MNGFNVAGPDECSGLPGWVDSNPGGIKTSGRRGDDGVQ
jgi:hypothetical protein